MSHHPHIGSSLDDFLEEEGILAAVSVMARKRVLAWEVKYPLMKIQEILEVQSQGKIGP